MTALAQSALLFALAGLAEIGGGYLMWLWWRDGRPWPVGLWGWAIDGIRPDRYDVLGGLVCLLGVAVIMYAPRGSRRRMESRHLA